MNGSHSTPHTVFLFLSKDSFIACYQPPQYLEGPFSCGGVFSRHLISLTVTTESQSLCFAFFLVTLRSEYP